MSKKNNSYVNSEHNIDKNETVNTGVTPVEGDNSIDKTIDIEGTTTADIPINDSSVADTQESEVVEQEDSTATTVKIVDEESIKIEEPVNNHIDNVSIAEKNETQNDEKTSDKSFFVSLGTTLNNKMNIVKERLNKAGFKSVVQIEDELAVGPFNTREECVAARRMIVGKGLKGKIVVK